MGKRFVSIWFRYLHTDWFALKQPQLHQLPFVLVTPSHGRMVITAANAMAEMQGVFQGMVVADARAIISSLQVMPDKPGLAQTLLTKLAEWCTLFTPHTVVDHPNGLIFDASGCAHLWGSDDVYLQNIKNKLTARGYSVQLAMADTIGAAWACARFGKQHPVIESGKQTAAILSLPPASLRLPQEIIDRLLQLGLRKVADIISIPASALRRRFGTFIIQRLQQATGEIEEFTEPVIPVLPFQDRLPCLEPIVTLTGIEIALKQLLASICNRLYKEQKGLRTAVFRCIRTDGKMIQLGIGTNGPSANAQHLFKLFELKLDTLEPEPGIELFILEVSRIEVHISRQEKLWESPATWNDPRITELVDHVSGKIGNAQIQRFLPAAHYWPERSFLPAKNWQEQPVIPWRTDRPRPIYLLPVPEKIEVSAPIPDYPPMLFRYRNSLHTIKKADGPERIEQEWWLQEGEHRDYYYVEDEKGQRYWLFRSGHYTGDKSHQWFIHGFFA